MTFFEIVRLLLRPELWELQYPKNPMFDDAIITKSGGIRFYADSPVAFRDGSGDPNTVLYKPGLLAWMCIKVLSGRLLRQVRRQETQDD